MAEVTQRCDGEHGFRKRTPERRRLARVPADATCDHWESNGLFRRVSYFARRSSIVRKAASLRRWFRISGGIHASALERTSAAVSLVMSL